MSDAIEAIMRAAPVIPVRVIDDPAHAAPFARLSVAGTEFIVAPGLTERPGLAAIEASARAAAALAR